MGSGPTTVRKLRVLHVVLGVNETNSQYNELCLPLRKKYNIAICSFFEPALVPPAEIQLFAGDGSIRTFLEVFHGAVSTRSNDVIHVHAPQSAALVVATLLRRLTFMRYRRNTVYTVHDSFYDYSRRNQALMTMALVAFKRIIFCSRSAYESVPRPIKWLVRNRWDVVQNGADIDRVTRTLDSATSKRETDAFTVLSVGRLEPVKDPATLIDAFSRLEGSDSRLVVVGGGSLESSVAEHARRVGLNGSVTQTGLIPREEVFVHCAEADVLVSTSRGEGLPVAIIEAMAAQCPVILSDIPPHRELADGADFIPIVPIGDVDGFARAVERFRRMSEAERSEIGRKCREHVLSRFALPTMHQGTESVYRKLPTVTDLPPARSE